jgi:carboxyl-terminal processing protease
MHLGAKTAMENNKKLPIIIVGIILVACVGIIGAGVGSYYLVTNYLPDILSGEQTGFFNGNEIYNEDLTADPITPPQPQTIEEGLFEPFWETRELLHDNFVSQPVNDDVLAEGAIEGLEMLLEEHELSLHAVSLSLSEEAIEELAKQAETPSQALGAFTPFWEAWSKLDNLDLPEELTRLQLMRAALNGMMVALDDPYTGYLDPDLARQWDVDLHGEYEGIGAWVDTSAEFLTIISPMPGSPAEAAGLLAGDRVIAIDGEDMTGIAGDIVIKRVLGPAGTKVVLTIERDNVDEPFDVTIIRERIVIPNVTYEILDDNIAYLQLISFSETSYRDLVEALEEMLAEDPDGLILDIRGNGGGYLHTAVNITSEFIEEGVILYEEYGSGPRDIHEARSTDGLATEIPLVVLINGGSASASEILAGAVQDYERGILVGTTTFGKGSVQLPISLKNDQGTARITVARWLTPNENHIQDIGLEPDVFVELTEEDILADEDPQLEKALEILLGQELINDPGQAN